MNTQDYSALVKRRAAHTPVSTNVLAAFWVGGVICATGEGLRNLYLFLGTNEQNALTLTTVTLIFIAAILTGFGIFDTIARYAGAGTLLPVTGFANAVVSPALDTKSEGLILGVGAKIFTVAGPVLLYSTLCGSIYGVIYYIYLLFVR